MSLRPNLVSSQAPQTKKGPFPRIAPTSSEFLNTFDVSGQKLEQPGDEQKRTPAGKEILSQRSLLLNRISNNSRGRPGAEPVSFGVRRVPRKFVQSAKRGPRNKDGRNKPVNQPIAAPPRTSGK